MRRRAAWLPLLLLALWAGPATSESRREPIGDGLVAVLTADGQVGLEASPQRGEGLLAFADRLCGTRDAAAGIRELNGNARQLLAGVRYRVEFSCLRPELQRRLLLGLFPDDAAEAEGWAHVVRAENGGLPVSLWRIAEWFTGNGQNFPEIRDVNGFDDEVLQPGQRVLVPRRLLLPGLRATLPPAPTRATASSVDIEYGSDGAGEYAIYRLKPGEALYTSVVVRMTGHLAAVDVNRLAGEIAERSGIVDVTDIPVGYRVKVPFDLLLPEFLPEGHPRRLEWQANLEASDRFSNQVQALDLAGITIILDAGHGGADVGASKSGVWESLYVYDIMARVRELFLQTTAAEVKATTRDGDAWAYHSRDVLPYSKGHTVLTDPPYRIEQGVVSTNLRWYLANSLYEQSLRRSADGEKTIFISIHADSLHPSLRGAMVYVPGLLPNPQSHGKSGAIYTSRREVRERPRVSFPWGDRVKSLGLSRELADQLLESFAARGLRVHDNHPVRDRVRKGRGVEYVPAVLRYNAVPSKVLLEVCNLANDEDRRLLQTQAYRQRVAEAIVDGVLRYYGYPERRRARQIVASSGG